MHVATYRSFKRIGVSPLDASIAPTADWMLPRPRRRKVVVPTSSIVAAQMSCLRICMMVRWGLSRGATCMVVLYRPQLPFSLRQKIKRTTHVHVELVPSVQSRDFQAEIFK